MSPSGSRACRPPTGQRTRPPSRGGPGSSRPRLPKPPRRSLDPALLGRTRPTRHAPRGGFWAPGRRWVRSTRVAGPLDPSERTLPGAAWARRWARSASGERSRLSHWASGREPSRQGSRARGRPLPQGGPAPALAAGARSPPRAPRGRSGAVQAVSGIAWPTIPRACGPLTAAGRSQPSPVRTPLGRAGPGQAASPRTGRLGATGHACRRPPRAAAGEPFPARRPSGSAAFRPVSGGPARPPRARAPRAPRAAEAPRPSSAPPQPHGPTRMRPPTRGDQVGRWRPSWRPNWVRTHRRRTLSPTWREPNGGSSPAVRTREACGRARSAGRPSAAWG